MQLVTEDGAASLAPSSPLQLSRRCWLPAVVCCGVLRALLTLCDVRGCVLAAPVCRCYARRLLSGQRLSIRRRGAGKWRTSSFRAGS